jgi:hypothetical protein
MWLLLTCQRCSRVSVKDVFKVMAQVDHDLTTVNCFDQRLGLIKNLGRHTPAPGNHFHVQVW